MGFFSWECKGCKKSALCSMAIKPENNFGWMTEVVVQFENGTTLIGEYDGYGRVDNREIGEDIISLWHLVCWEAAGRPAYKGPSVYAHDQGWFFDERNRNFP